MRLAEALVQRADQQRKIAQLKQRLSRVVKVQEGDVPAEDPKILMSELHEAIGSLSQLIKKINKTNSFTLFSEGVTLADILAERDRIIQERNALNEILEAASVRQDAYSRSEIRFYRTIEIPELQSQVDGLSKSYRELDFKIQEKNWTVDLIDT
ncbi:DIP1984 family protein [Saccharibacillus sp. JS10]|uniref:DIP1984 family protein n=1 Tax=Saccharibacillus sp. JS10 TaxID=2950552 RepID=UPI00210E324E|nr:DIP1984 family protein [Saccharibacillus sp. JS10]MCQ4085358.1 DIP1984 family protein [Saccharibacillus sp. JS10]